MARDARYFRSLNERIARDAEALGVEGPYLLLVCECLDPHCFRLIRATRDEFDALRSQGTRYAIYPGHESIGDERLLDSTGRFTLVEKFAS